jgi:hypothetical protein
LFCAECFFMCHMRRRIHASVSGTRSLVPSASPWYLVRKPDSLWEDT